MKKGIVIIMACSVIGLMGTVLLSNAGAKKEADNISEYGYEVNQSNENDKANEAHKLLFGTFEDAPGGPVYPEDFCGDYVEDGKLHVMLTNTSPETVEKYRGLTGNSDAVVFELGKASLNDLNKFQEKIGDYYSEEGLSANIMYVDQKETKLIIGFDADKIETAEKLLEEYIENNKLEMLKGSILIVEEGRVVPE